MLSRFLVALLLLLVVTAKLSAQTGDSKATQVEEMRKLRQQMIEEQKTIQQQNEWNTQSSQQEIKKLNQENQQKSMQIQTSRQEAERARLEANQAREDMIRAKQVLEAKQRELALTQMMIDSAKAELALTHTQLEESEMVIKRTKEALQHQEDSVKMLMQTQELQNLKLRNQEMEIHASEQQTKITIIGGALLLSLIVVLGAFLYTRQQSIKQLAEKNRIIEEEKKRSDDLLLNILPAEVMQELKAQGKTQPRNYAKATVLFADIKNFTAISEILSPDDLIEGLDAYFERFDKVIEKYGIEKIKTIGDAYVCAGGVPTKNDVNPHEVVQAALDFQYEIGKLKREREAKGKIPFEFRIGIHTGHLVAGVIGLRKFAYDIWGDTVNMAARMEQASEANKINISGATYELVKDKFACVYRGKVEAKNKGEIDMYFVEKLI